MSEFISEWERNRITKMCACRGYGADLWGYGINNLPVEVVKIPEDNPYL